MFFLLFHLAGGYAFTLTYFCHVLGQRRDNEIVSLLEKLREEANRCVALVRGEAAVVQRDRELDAPRR